MREHMVGEVSCDIPLARRPHMDGATQVIAAAVLAEGPPRDSFVSSIWKFAREVRAVGAPVILWPLNDGNVPWIWAAGDICAVQCDVAGFYPGGDVVDILGLNGYFNAPSLPASARRFEATRAKATGARRNLDPLPGPRAAAPPNTWSSMSNRTSFAVGPNLTCHLEAGPAVYSTGRENAMYPLGNSLISAISAVRAGFASAPPPPPPPPPPVDGTETTR